MHQESSSTAMFRASTSTARDGSVNRSNICSAPCRRARMRAATVLLVDSLLGDSELAGDLRPRPPEVACSVYVQGLQLLSESSEGGDGSKSDRRVAAPGAGCKIQRGHAVNVACRMTLSQERLTIGPLIRCGESDSS